MEFTYLVIVFSLVFYFLPSFVAYRRSPPHPQIPGVVLTNLFLGWTLVGMGSFLGMGCTELLTRPSSGKRGG